MLSILIRIASVLTSTNNLCFEQKYEQCQNFYLKTFSFLEVKFSIYLNWRVFVMKEIYYGRKSVSSRAIPAYTQRRINIVTTSLQRRGVAATL